MAEDLKFIENLVNELDDNIAKWSSEKVFDKTNVMFVAFHNRFAVEDFLIRHARPTAEMQVVLKDFLRARSKFRDHLETILILQIADPGFRTAFGKIRQAASKHLDYVKTVFEPNFVDQVLVDEVAQSKPLPNISPTRLHVTEASNRFRTGTDTKQIKRSFLK
jgi:hypothetical protein